MVWVAGATGRPIEEVAEVFFAVGAELRLDWIETELERVPATTRMQRWALQAVREDAAQVRRELAGGVLAETVDGDPATERVEAFLAERGDALRRLDAFLRVAVPRGRPDLAGLTLAVRQLRALVSWHQPGRLVAGHTRDSHLPEKGHQCPRSCRSRWSRPPLRSPGPPRRARRPPRSATPRPRRARLRHRRQLPHARPSTASSAVRGLRANASSRPPVVFMFHGSSGTGRAVPNVCGRPTPIAVFPTGETHDVLRRLLQMMTVQAPHCPNCSRTRWALNCRAEHRSGGVDGLTATWAMPFTCSFIRLRKK